MEQPETTTTQAEERAPLPPSNAILTLLSGLEGGDFAAELSEEMAELVQLVRDRHADGHITIKLKLSPKGQQMMIKADYAVKSPPVDRGVSIRFSDEDGRLLKDDPNQPTFEFGTQPAK